MSLLIVDKPLGEETLQEAQRCLDIDGYYLLRGAIALADVGRLREDLERSLRDQSEVDGSIRRHHDVIAAARNLIKLWSGTADVARCLPMRQIITAVLGADAGLVRGLYFDKPPGASWSLPWHKDMTIAVQQHVAPSHHFSKPTTKAGVPHVEAPTWLLESMLTARVHLDDVTDENGPLRVIRGSHRHGKTGEATPGVRQDSVNERSVEETVLAKAGDILMMRPLVDHCSGHSRPESALHRRIIHLEYAANRDLPDKYHWHDFLPIN